MATSITGTAAVSCKIFDAAPMDGKHGVPESLLGDVLPLLLQETGELVHVNRRRGGGDVPDMLGGLQIRRKAGGRVLPKDPMLLQEVCDDLSSVRSGVVVLQSGAWSMACSAGWGEGANDLVPVA